MAGLCGVYVAQVWQPGKRPCSDTLLVHCLNVLMSSWMTRSMHFRQGSFSLMICFFTMASNAKSGVNRPVLKDIQTRQTWRRGARQKSRERHTGRGRDRQTDGGRHEQTLTDEEQKKERK